MVLLEISTFIAAWGYLSSALPLPPSLSLFFDNDSDPVLVPAHRFSQIRLEGLISKFASGSGRTGTDRQFVFINGRPCAPVKVQKAINEVYRTFNANQSPFVIADFLLPTSA